MQNVWLDFKACLNSAHTLVARIVSSFLPVVLLFSFLSCEGFFPIFKNSVTSQPSMKVKGELIDVTFLLQPQINMLNRLITPPDELRVEVFHVTHTTHAHTVVSLWLQCVVVAEGACSRRVRRQQHSQSEDTVGGEGRWGLYVAKMGKSPPSQPTARQQGGAELPTPVHSWLLAFSQCTAGKPLLKCCTQSLMLFPAALLICSY